MLDALAERDDYDRTAVFLVSDHGELFGEHGLTNHGNSLYEPDVRILLLGRVPEIAAQTYNSPAHGGRGTSTRSSRRCSHHAGGE